MNDKSDYIVCFVGLPSSGKSSLINSLLLRRKVQTGVCRTTTAMTLFDDVVHDDDGNQFRVMDLPGMCDGEDKDGRYDELTYAHVTNAHLIFWVSDVNKAFVTSHEVNEFKKLNSYLEQLSNSTGTLYDVGIILSKCSSKADSAESESEDDDIDTPDNDELNTRGEDTNINDVIDKVKEKFQNHHVMLFNAHGRSYYHPKTTKRLKQFVEELNGIPTPHNTSFKITQYISSYDRRSVDYKDNVLIERFEKYLTQLYNLQNINHVTSLYETLSDDKQLYFANKFGVVEYKDKSPMQLFGINQYLFERYRDKKEYKGLMQIGKNLFHFYIQCLNRGWYMVIQNFNKELINHGNVLQHMHDLINYITCNDMCRYLSMILTDTQYLTQYSVNVLKKVFDLQDDKYYDVVKRIANDAFVNKKMHILNMLRDWCNGLVPPTLAGTMCRLNGEIDHDMDAVYQWAEQHLSSNYYILRTKIEVYNICTQPVLGLNLNVLITSGGDNNRAVRRAISTQRFRDIKEKILHRVYENIKYECIDITTIQPLDVSEILYKID